MTYLAYFLGAFIVWIITLIYKQEKHTYTKLMRASNTPDDRDKDSDRLWWLALGFILVFFFVVACIWLYIVCSEPTLSELIQDRAHRRMVGY